MAPMSKRVIASAFLLLACAFLLPIGPVAVALGGVEPGSPRFDAVADGIAIFKGLLALHGLLLVIAARFAPRGAACEPLVERGLRTPPPSRPSTVWGLGGLLALAFSLRLYRVEVGLSYDEIDTLVHYARRPLGEVLTTYDSQNHHVLFSLLARLAVVGFGETAASLRLPAVILGVFGIWALYRLALRVADARESIFAAALLTVSYHHVWFSQSARGYTGLMLFALLGTIAFFDMLAERAPRGVSRPLVYGLWMALGAWTHATAVFVSAAHGVVWLFTLWTARKRAAGANRWQPALGFLFTLTLTALLYSFVLPQLGRVLFAPSMPGVETEWKEPGWLVMETLRGLSSGLPGGSFTIATGAILGMLGLRSYYRQSVEVLATFLLPTLITAASLLATSHNLWPRLFFSSGGFFVLIALRGVTEWARIFSFGPVQGLIRKMTDAALGLLCLISVASLFERVWLPKQDFEGALAFVQAGRRDGDAVATVDMTVLPYSEYFGAGWTPVDTVEALESLEASHDRTWIVYSTPTRLKAAQPEIWSRLEQRYDVQREFGGTLGGSEVVVALYERPDR
jgi:mannosyltransferase